MNFAQLRIDRHHVTQCIIAIALLLGISAGGLAEPANSDTLNTASAEEQEALDTVSQRIAGYNSHDIDAFLAAHSVEVRIYGFPDRKIGVGRAHLERIFGPQFERREGRVDVLQQIAIGNRVVSHENITIGQKVERLVAVYTVERDQIISFRLIESDD